GAGHDPPLASQVLRQDGVAGQIAGPAEILFERPANPGLVEDRVRRGWRMARGPAHEARLPATAARTGGVRLPRPPGAAAASKRGEPSGATVRNWRRRQAGSSSGKSER